MEKATQQQTTQSTHTPIGGVVLAQGEVAYNTGRPTTSLTVRNTGDRPVQVGSHFHFFEVNRHLEFDRSQAFGKHLNIPATTAIRFEPGDQKSVTLVPYGGKCRVVGFGGLVGGFAGSNTSAAWYPKLAKAMSRAYKRGYKTFKKTE
jgi:urease subunit beta